MGYPLPANELKRLEALRLYAALDLSPRHGFEDIARAAAELAEVPTALVSLIDEQRQWFMGSIGFTGAETPREETFCTHTILGADLMLVENATLDSRFSENPHVTAANGVRFYAGAPIVDDAGHAIGSLCVVDSRPRQLSRAKQATLMALARTAMRLLEHRRLIHLLGESLKEVKTVQGFLPICASCKSIRTDDGYWNRIEEYFSTRTDARLSHGVCPDCFRCHYPDVYRVLETEGKLDSLGRRRPDGSG